MGNCDRRANNSSRANTNIRTNNRFGVNYSANLYEGCGVNGSWVMESATPIVPFVKIIILWSWNTGDNRKGNQLIKLKERKGKKKLHRVRKMCGMVIHFTGRRRRRRSGKWGDMTRRSEDIEKVCVLIGMEKRGWGGTSKSKYPPSSHSHRHQSLWAEDEK